ncbi:MAG: acyltransferase [Lachnospiraceae bacterium]|nr:acyltransferase [Lachnospiraceae bacterium]
MAVDVGKKRRNGELDILRLFFAIAIMFYHVDKADRIREGFFANGWFAVEYFFVLSGLLLARHAFAVRERYLTEGKTDAEALVRDIPSEVCRYTLKKAAYFYKYFIVTLIIFFGMQIANQVSLYGGKTAVTQAYKRIVDSIPHFLLIDEPLHKQGSLYVTGNWYLSVLVVATFILYALILRYGRSFTVLVCPVASLFLTGYITSAAGSFHPVHAGSVSFGFLRGLAEMCMGACMYELSAVIKDKVGDKRGSRVLVTVVKYLLFVGIMLFALGAIDEAYAVSFYLMAAIAVCLSYSGAGYGIAGNVITDHAGKISLIIYLVHGLVLYEMQHVSTDSGTKYSLIYASAVIIGAEILFFLVNFIVKCIFSKRKNA